MDLSPSEEPHADKVVGRNAVIGINVSPLKACFTAILSWVLESGYCFVFLPLEETQNYLVQFCKDSDVELVITSQEKSMKWNFIDSIPCFNDLICGRIKPGPSMPTDSCPQLAYVIRTSGSTGVPKIVRVPCCCIQPNINDFMKIFEMTKSDVVSMCSPLTFDPCVVDILLTLKAECRLLVADENLKRNPVALAEYMFEENSVTFLQITPSLLMRFGTEVLRTKVFGKDSGIRILALGGEQFPNLNLLRRFLHPKNKTRIFNLYGITEVSCWAACAEVTDLLHSTDCPNEDVGISGWLSGTKWEVRDTNCDEKILTKNGDIGELYIGGEERKCLLPGETWDSAPELRATGDIVRIAKDGQSESKLMFLGRKNEYEIKRNGQRVNLREIEKAVCDVQYVISAKVVFEESTGMIFLGFTRAENYALDSENLETKIRKRLEKWLPRHCLPDFFAPVEFMPVTHHGKLDKQGFIQLVRKGRQANIPKGKKSVRQVVLSLIQSWVPFSNTSSIIDKQSRIVDLGVDSMKAVSLVNELERIFSKNLPETAQLILEGATIEQLCNHVETVGKDISELPQKRAKIDIPRSDSKRTSPQVTNGLGFGWNSCGFLSIERGNRLQHFRPDSAGFVEGTQLNVENNLWDNNSKLEIEWAWDSKKCIDASPLLLVNRLTSGERVFIGSHSGDFASLKLEDGTEFWKVNLDRIVGSGCIADNGRLVVTGSYDRFVYFLEVYSGTEYWKFETGDIVKTDPLAHPDQSLVFIGSHDRNFYCLDYSRKLCVWSVPVEGTVVSRPCLDSEGLHVFLATLASTVLCFSAVEGQFLWKQCLDKPVFAGLSFLSFSRQNSTNLLLVPCVDGFIYGISPTDGFKMIKYYCGGPLFATLSVNKSLITVSVRTDERANLLCLSVNANVEISEKWKKQLQSELIGSPFRFEMDNRELICVAAKCGIVYLIEGSSGEIFANFKIDQNRGYKPEVFSSPVVSPGGKILVGCRDNMLYCLSFKSDEKSKSL